MREEERTVRRFSAFGSVFLAVGLLLSALSVGFSAQAIELDGLLKEKMWLESELVTVIRLQDEPNCSVDTAKVIVGFDEKNYITYIGCRFMHKKQSDAAEEGEQPQSLSGVAIQVEDAQPLIFTAGNSDAVNSDDYRIEGAAFLLSDTCTTAEILIGQKRGFGDPLHVQLRFYDADGVVSNVYPLSIEAPVLPTMPAFEINTTVTSAPPKTAKPTTSRTQKETQPTAQRITQEKTTVEKTTKEKTTKEKTTKEKTTKEKTTKGKTTRAKMTKAAKTTKLKTTAAKKAKTTKAAQELSNNNELLQQVMAEQAKTRNALYIGIGALIVAVFVVCSLVLKRKEE